MSAGNLLDLVEVRRKNPHLHLGGRGDISLRREHFSAQRCLVPNAVCNPVSTEVLTTRKMHLQ